MDDEERHERDAREFQARLDAITERMERESAKLGERTDRDAQRKRQMLRCAMHVQHAVEFWARDVGEIPPEERAECLAKVGGDLFATALIDIKHLPERRRNIWLAEKLNGLVMKLSRYGLIGGVERLSPIAGPNGQPIKKRPH